MWRAQWLMLALLLIPATADARKSLCVISTIGETFALQSVGITVLGNEFREEAINAWAIDDLIVSKAATLLAKNFAVRRFAAHKPSFAEYLAVGGLIRDFEAELKRAVEQSAAAAAHKCTYYLVAVRTFAPYGSTNQSIRGLGIVKGPGEMLKGAWHLHALFRLRVYDGTGFEVQREALATINQPTSFMDLIRGPHRELDASLWPGEASVVQNVRIRDVTRALVEQCVTVTLPTLLATD